jgi:hypothetical protein
VHPLASEGLLAAVGRSELLAAAFGIAALALFVRVSGSASLGGWRLVLSAALFFLALCSKESAAALLVVGGVFWFLYRSVLPARPAVLVGRVAAYLAAFGVFLGLRSVAVGWGTTQVFFVDNPLTQVGAVTRIVNAVLLQGRYALKMIWPASLSSDYGFDQIPVVPLLPWGLPAAAALVGLWVVVVLLLRRVSPAAAFLWAFPLAAFAVTANVVLAVGVNFAERLAYLPVVGACGLVGYGLYRVEGRRVAAAGVLALLVLAGGARTYVRAGDYRDTASFLESAVEATPRAIKSLNALGRHRLHAEGDAEGAIPPLERAVTLWPDYPRALRLLGEAYMATGDQERAMDYMMRARAAAAKVPER